MVIFNSYVKLPEGTVVYPGSFLKQSRAVHMFENQVVAMFELVQKFETLCVCGLKKKCHMFPIVINWGVMHPNSKHSQMICISPLHPMVWRVQSLRKKIKKQNISLLPICCLFCNFLYI